MSAVCNLFNLAVPDAAMHLCHLAQYNIHYSDVLLRGIQSLMYLWLPQIVLSDVVLNQTKIGINEGKALPLP